MKSASVCLGLLGVRDLNTLLLPELPDAKNYKYKILHKLSKYLTEDDQFTLVTQVLQNILITSEEYNPLKCESIS